MKGFILGLSLLGITLSCFATQTRTVTLAWDPSPDAGVTGYKVYSGVVSRGYTNVYDVGNVVTVTVPVVEGVTNFFAATVYSADTQESDFSNEAFYFAAGTAEENITLIFQPGQSPVVSFPVQVGKAYILQASTNLVNWEDIVTTAVQTNSTTLNFTDDTALPSRFYRLQIL